jgi:flagellar basal-body rod protein FlgB
MSSFLDSASMDLLQKKLDAVWMRQQVIAGNIANAATPGYKSKTVAFEAQLRQKLNATGVSDRSIQSALDRVQPTIVRQEGTEAREDGKGPGEVAPEMQRVRQQRVAPVEARAAEGHHRARGVDRQYERNRGERPHTRLDVELDDTGKAKAKARSASSQ